MAQQAPLPPQVSQEGPLRRAVRAVVRFFVRLVLILFLFAMVALAVYYGIPWLHRTYIQPLYDLQIQVQNLEAQVQDLERSVGAALDQTYEQMDVLAQEQETQQQKIEDVEARLRALEQSLDTQSEYVQALEAEIRDLQEAYGQAEATLTALDVRLSDLEALIDRRWPLWQQAQQDLLVSRVMIHLLRAQLYLSQENYASARGELAVLADMLDERLALLPDPQLDLWQELASRIDQAEGALPDRPVEAQRALDAAWNLLMSFNPATPGVPIAPRTEPPSTPSSSETP